VIRSYRDDEGKPRHEALGAVGVFDKQIKPALAQQLTSSERVWLRYEMEKTEAVCVAESRHALERLASRVDKVTDDQLQDDGIYGSVLKLSKL